jgi:hypothetical protein
MWKVVDAAEELGFADVWFGDHIAVPPYAAALTPPDWFDAVALCLVGLGRTTGCASPRTCWSPPTESRWHSRISSPRPTGWAAAG